jgi:hypothetical protein
MAIDTWLVYLLAAIGLSLSPGPNGLLALTHGALHGQRKALYTIAGGVLGFVIIIALSMFGIGALLQARERSRHDGELREETARGAALALASVPPRESCVSLRPYVNVRQLGRTAMRRSRCGRTC